MNRLLTLLLALAPAAAIHPLHAQDSGAAGAASKVPVLSLADLKVTHFSPEHLDVDRLARIGHELLGRYVYVEERGGVDGRPIENMDVLGGQIVIFDTPAYAERMIALLRTLDRPPSDPTVERTVSRSFVPKHVSTDSVLRALQPWMRNSADGQANLSVVEERRTVVLRDSVAHVEEMLEVAGQIDRPEEQALITCYVLLGEKDAEDDGSAPEALLEDLRRLVPDLGFQTLGYAMVQSSVVPRRDLELSVVTDPDGRFQIRFEPVAYDPATGSITARKCRVSVKSNSPAGAVAGMNSMLESDLVFRGGQYTVLGATGKDPVFFVVHVQPVR